MTKQTKQAVKQVLNEAGDAPHFFDLSDAERLNWLIARAFELGNKHKAIRSINKKGRSHEYRK